MAPDQRATSRPAPRATAPLWRFVANDTPQNSEPTVESKAEMERFWAAIDGK